MKKNTAFYPWAAESLLLLQCLVLVTSCNGTVSHAPVFVYDGVEELPVPPAAGEVVAAQTLVSLHHPLGPEQQLLLGRHVVRLAVHLNVRNLTGETSQRVWKSWPGNGHGDLPAGRSPVGWPVVCKEFAIITCIFKSRKDVYFCNSNWA